MRIRITAIAAVLLLTLAGCSAAPVPPEPNYPVSETAETEVSETVAPLVAETSEAEVSEFTEPEDAYLREIHAQMEQPISQIPPAATDDQLLAAADKACELMAAGTEFSEITVLEGETRLEATNDYRDSATIADAAQRNLCPGNPINYGDQIIK